MHTFVIIVLPPTNRCTFVTVQQYDELSVMPPETTATVLLAQRHVTVLPDTHIADSCRARPRPRNVHPPDVALTKVSSEPCMPGWFVITSDMDTLEGTPTQLAE